MRRPRPAPWWAALAGLLALALWLRLHGLDWDAGEHLHPDERYLSLVADAVRLPSSLVTYLDVGSSPLSPYRTPAGADYLYGLLPLLGTKLAAALVGLDGYGELYRVGRALSALLDTVSVALVFLLARRLLPPASRVAGALVAAALYAGSVTAIQHAHFFTVESWLVCATLATFLLALHAAAPVEGTGVPLARLAALGAAIGLTLACKASGGIVLLPVALALAVLVRRARGLAARAVTAATAALVTLAAAYVAFRLVSPYSFQHSSWLELAPNRSLRAALERQQEAMDGAFLYPPAYQWLLRQPLLDPAQDELTWGLGPLLGLAAIAGLACLAVDLVRARRGLVPGRLTDGQAALAAAMLLLFVAVTFGYFGSRFASSLRYLVPMVPFVCVAAAYGLARLRSLDVGLWRGAAAVVAAGTLLYALAFTTVYRAPHTRVAAAAWVAGHVPAGATLATESWDDGLPLGAAGPSYEALQLPVFDPDDDAKLRKLYDGLRQADVYVLSSPRAWRTVGHLPDRFPLMGRFYRALDAGRLGFRRAAAFASEPRLLGATLPDVAAEESFWVYDHPPVLVYRRTSPPSWPAFRDAVCGGAALPGCG